MSENNIPPQNYQQPSPEQILNPTQSQERQTIVNDGGLKIEEPSSVYTGTPQPSSVYTGTPNNNDMPYHNDFNKEQSTTPNFNPNIEPQPQSAQQSNNSMPVNPLLAKTKIPGKTIRLPSRGSLYSNGELMPGVKDGEIEIFPLTSYNEIVFNNPDKLLNGDAIIQTFKECAPQVQKPLELFANDLDYIMISLRLISYGNKYEVVYTHGCNPENPKLEIKYDLDVEQMLTESTEIDPTTINQRFSLQLPNTQVVTLKPVRVQQMLNINQMDAEKDSIEEIQIKLLHSLVNIIDNVDGITDKNLIAEWVKSLTPEWVKLISNRINETSNWGPSLKQTFTCKECKQTVKDVPISINPLSFFS